MLESAVIAALRAVADAPADERDMRSHIATVAFTNAYKQFSGRDVTPSVHINGLLVEVSADVVIPARYPWLVRRHAWDIEAKAMFDEKLFIKCFPPL